MNKIFFFICLLSGGVIAWVIWGLAAPALCALIPMGEWKSAIDTLIYILIGCFGGAGIPIGILAAGIKILMEVEA